MKNSKDDKKPSASFVVGAIALVFLIIGYQVAVFIHKASIARIIANHDEPDTVYVLSQNEGAIRNKKTGSGANENVNGKERSEYSNVKGRSEYVQRQGGEKNGNTGKESSTNGGQRRDANHSKEAMNIRLQNSPKRCESFRFDPNTASIEELTRLGFTLKQAESIDNYRQKGGKFRRKSDFAKSYVVADSVYKRLEPFIDIPKIDLNTADSTAFETLPGIGKFFASKMVSYRKELGGYSYSEQLMDIWKFDQAKFDALKDLISVEDAHKTEYPLWTMSEEMLKKHPYIGKYSAHSIVLFRENTPKTDWTIENLAKAGILKEENVEKLSRCLIAKP